MGESGSGKSQLLLACTGLLAANGRASGSVRFDGKELLGAGDPAARIRGRGIGFVFQDASGSLTPHRRIGEQLAETGVAASGITHQAALFEAVRMLERVRLPEARRHLTDYPHELSGGMRQRVAIAAALMPRPQLLFADEPTTALDVTVQAEIIALLAELCRELGMAMLLVTHDLGVVSGLADRIAVMYAGRIVESAEAARFLAAPRHPYSAGLLAAVPSLDDPPGSELRTIAGDATAPGHDPAGLPLRAALRASAGALPQRGPAHSSCRAPQASPATFRCMRRSDECPAGPARRDRQIRIGRQTAARAGGSR